MKNVITSTILLLALLLPALTYAHDFEVDGIYYNRINDNEVEVTLGRNGYFHYRYSGTVTIPATVTYDGTTYSVTKIGENAFIRSTGLTSVDIPNSVTSIGDYAFEECTALTSIVIPNSVTEIGRQAFMDCTGLTSIDIPNSVTAISSYAFYNTAWYDNQPDGLVYAGMVAYRYKGTMPSGTNMTLKEGTLGIAVCAFMECTGLTSIVIPNSVTSIGECAFLGCTGLTSIDIPNSVTSIGRQAFDGCTGLTSINIPNSETSIDEYAFVGCTGLTSIVIPNSVTDIGDGAFHGCTGLTSIVVESGNPRYDSRNNCNAIIETANNTLIYGCNNTIIPNTVTSIGCHAFYKCAGLTSIDIPNSVTSIGAWAFYYCTEVTSINIPNSVTSIEDRAFIGCTGDVYSYIDNLSLVSMDSDVFYMYPPNYNKRTLHVPVGSLKAYQADSRWSEFFGNIVEMKP